MANYPSESNISQKSPPDHIGLLVAAVIMMLIGWGGLYRLITTTLPRIGGELWLFFALLQIAVTGLAIPFVRFFNIQIRNPERPIPPSGVIVRQSVWIGLFIVICAWLQIPRALSLPAVFFVGLVFVVIEMFLRSRETQDRP
jgi:hypothetical protein